MAAVSTASTATTISLSTMQEPQDHRTGIGGVFKRRPSKSAEEEDARSTHSSSSFFGISWDGRDRSNRSLTTMDSSRSVQTSSHGGARKSPFSSPKNAKTLSKREGSFFSRLLPPLSPKKVGKGSTRSPPRSRTNSLDSLSEDSGLAAALYQGDDMNSHDSCLSDDDDTSKKRPSLVFAGLHHVVMNLSMHDGDTASGVFSAFTAPGAAEARKEKLRLKKEQLCRELETLDLQLENARLELHTRQEAFESVHEVHQEELDEWTQRLKTATNKWLEVCQREQLMRRTPLHTYVSPLRRASCPSYIITLESQVCQSVHHMCMVEDQKSAHKKNADSLEEWLKAESDRHRQDKSTLQSGLLRRQFELQDQIRQFRSTHDLLLEEQKMEMERLESTLWKRNLKDKEWVKEELLASVVSPSTAVEPSRISKPELAADIAAATNGDKKQKKSHRRTSTYSYSEGLLARSKQSLTTTTSTGIKALPPAIPEEDPREMDLNAIVAEAIIGLDGGVLPGEVKKTTVGSNQFDAPGVKGGDDDVFKPPSTKPPKRRRHRRGVTLH